MLTNEELEAIVKLNGLDVVDVGGGGDCFFRSLSDQLYCDNGVAHASVRAMLTSWLGKFDGGTKIYTLEGGQPSGGAATLESFALAALIDVREAQRGGSAFRRYVAAMEKRGTFADTFMVGIAATALHTNIIMFSSKQDREVELFQPFQFVERYAETCTPVTSTVYLRLIPPNQSGSGGHYQSVRNAVS